MSVVLKDRRPTILLVEDSPDEEMLVMRAVRRSSIACQMLVAHTTDEALDFLFGTGPFQGRESRNPDVIVTDLKVGSLGGAGLISAVRENAETRLIPIVVLTGSASEEQIDDAYRRGANSFIEKPMDFDEFATTITNLAGYWGLLNATASHARSLPSFPYSL
jgi:two-component system response regulator